MPSKKNNFAVTNSSVNSVSATNRPNRGRHSEKCSVCKHPQQAEIESEFIDWVSPARLVRKYKLRDRSSIYRHCHAANLFGRRLRNLRRVPERIAEQVCDVTVTAGAVIAAVQLLAKLNSRGQLVEREELIDLHELFDRMSPEELERYVLNKELPNWFHELIGATTTVPDAEDHDD